MRMSLEEKTRSHSRIVTSAARLFRAQGLEQTSVSDVMNDAGMTHGGFYKHFDSKEGLLEEALESAFDEFVSALESSKAKEAFAAYRTLYLSRKHLAQPGYGCPVAALGAEVARESRSLKVAFGNGVKRIVGVIAASRRGAPSARRKTAIREFSLLVGAMVIARASDPAFADEVLSACAGETSNVD